MHGKKKDGLESMDWRTALAIANPTHAQFLGELKNYSDESAPGSRRIDLDAEGNIYNIELPYSGLKALPTSIGQLHALETLDLSHNQLTTLPDSFGHLKWLETLNLNENQLNQLPESFGQLRALRTLDLRDNQLTMLPETFGQLRALQALDLSANRITTLPESIGQLEQIRILFLNGNQLTVLPESFKNLAVSLQIIDLTDNQLPSLTIDRLPPSMKHVISWSQTMIANKSLTEPIVVQIGDYAQEKSLARCITTDYIRGADIIHLDASTPISSEIQSIIKKTVSKLIGTEISEIEADKITIRILVDPLKFPLDHLITFIYRLADGMHRDAIKSLAQKDAGLAKDVTNRESKVEKVYHLMLRLLNLPLIGRLTLSDICESDLKIDGVLGTSLAHALRRMAHSAMQLAEQALKLIDKDLDAALIDHLTEMSRFVLQMQREAFLALYKSDVQRVQRVISSASAVREYHRETERKISERVADPSSISCLTSISRNLRNIASRAVAIAQDLKIREFRMRLIAGYQHL